ncbi:MAG: hypothetical protein ACRDHG_06660 [Anaerolineales bacterium]
MDARKVRRYATISRVLSFGGMGIMGVGLVVSFRQTTRLDAVLGLFLAGMIASQLGIPMRNRWDRHPRIDELLDQALKGLDGRFAIYHYALGASHAVVCPAGIFALLPRFENGAVEYREGRWLRTTQSRGRLRRGGIRRIDGLDRQAAAEAERLQRRLMRRLGSTQIQPVDPLVVFLHSEADVRSDGAPTRAVHLKKLKEALRKLPKGQTLSDSQLQMLGNG